MAWTDLGAWTSRATITKARLDAISDNFTELKLHTHDGTDGDGAAQASLAVTWSTFATTWSAAVGSPAIGNGVLTMRYCRIGKLVVVVMQLTAGSTTTYGTSGAYAWTLPITGSATKSGYGVAFLYDSSATTTNVAAARNATGATTLDLRHHGGTVAVGVTAPWTWAQSDEIGVMFAYEAA